MVKLVEASSVKRAKSLSITSTKLKVWVLKVKMAKNIVIDVSVENQDEILR